MSPLLGSRPTTTPEEDMDPKTKAMLHTAGATLAHQDPQKLVIEFEAFPPSYKFFASSEMFTHPSANPEVLAAAIATQMSQGIAKAVKEQILKHWEMDAQQGMKVLWDHKVEKSQDPDWVTFGDPKKDSLYGQHELYLNPEPPWVSMNTLQEFKKLMEEKFDATLWQAQNLDFSHPHPSNHASGVAMDFSLTVEEQMGTFKSKSSAGSAVVDLFTKLIPGFVDMAEDCPVDNCAAWAGSVDWSLQQAIIHLNDHHKWTREEIADWLETLDHDLRIKTPEEVNEDGN